MTAPKETQDAKATGKKDKAKKGTTSGAAAKPHKKKGAARGKKAAAEKAPAEDTLPPVDDRYLRLQADFDNYRKRVLREKEDIYKLANQDIIEELLPVIDHVELAFSSVGETHQQDPVVEGFRMVAEQLLGVLTKFGLVPIETDGQEFDPNLHEAILHMPSDEVAENFVVSQARGGYKLGERLIRASQVVVSSGPAENGSTDD